MTRKRKTEAERRQERAELERQQWEYFRPKLLALRTYEDAVHLLNESPRPDSPGRRFYSNLGFFLQTFFPPGGSSYYEKAVYLEFVKGLNAQGILKPGSIDEIEENFRVAMERQGPYMPPWLS